jgi:hypothetical protein
MNSINANKAGLTLSIAVGGWHLLWSIFVAAGWVHAILNFVFWMHFIKPSFTIEPFDLVRAVMLVLIASVIGYIIGFILATIWNLLHR